MAGIMMVYSLLADLIILLHFMFILFVLCGGLLVLKWKWLIFIHIPAAIYGILIEIESWVCPLTPLEVHFKMKAGESIYQGGFIEHYLIPIIYPPGLNRTIQIILAAMVLILNIIIYTMVFYKYKSNS
jgi:hypothetical protein